MIPTFVIKDMLTIIIAELAFDVSSSIVRTAVFQVSTGLVCNHFLLSSVI